MLKRADIRESGLEIALPNFRMPNCGGRPSSSSMSADWERRDHAVAVGVLSCEASRRTSARHWDWD